MPEAASLRFIRLGKQCHEVFGLSHTTQYRMIQRGTLRPPRKLSDRIQGWLAAEIEDDLRALPRTSEIKTQN